MISTVSPDRPLPVPTSETRPFWSAAAKNILMLPHCGKCSSYLYPPVSRCPTCLNSCFVWNIVSDQARLVSWTEVFAAVLPGVPPPFIVAEVELGVQPGLIMVANIVEAKADQLWVGQPMQVVFLATSNPEIALPQFRPIQEGQDGA